jgi:DNA-binding NarL/FixJ family response regulator
LKRILIADDHHIIRQGVRLLLADKPFEICGEAGDGAEAVKMSADLKPDLVILDVSMPGMTGVEALRQIRAVAPTVKVVLFTMHNAAALKDAGADAVVVKSQATDVLLHAVESLLDGHHETPLQKNSLG